MKTKNGSKWVLREEVDPETGDIFRSYFNDESGYAMDADTFESLGGQDPDEYAESYCAMFRDDD